MRPAKPALIVAASALICTGVAAVQIARICWQCRRQAVAVAKIESLGGTVDTVDETPAWAGPLALGWAAKPFEVVKSVSLVGTNATDSDLADLEPLTGVEWLGLDRTRVTDAGLVHIRHLTRLRSLELSETVVGDRGLADLARMNRLWLLGLQRTRVTDVGLAQLRDLTNLRILDVEGTRVTETGICHLMQDLPGLLINR
jgi:hypothetical protein